MIINNKKSSQEPEIAGEEIEEKLTEKLTEIKIKELEERAKIKAQQIGIPYINLVAFPIPSEALRLIPLEEAKKYKIICFYRTEKEAKVAAVDLSIPGLKDFVQKIAEDNNLKVRYFLISEYSFKTAYKLYSALPKITKIIKGVKITERELKEFGEKIKTFRDLNREIKNVSITDIVTLIIASALKSRASDIHIEAEEEDIKVRFRIDGILIDVASLQKKLWPQVISRIKLFSGLKINITDKPQDGRFTIYLTNEEVDVRVSCLPTAYGESVVMRILRSSATGLAFEDLGIRGRAFEELKREISRPNGMIITTGPTGSGKTTTLYAILNKLNKPETKIITLENPIEYRLKGINQSQVDESKGYTFAKGLRSILRQDPDVVMVGEIRDLETAEIAIQAALTGHLVISTLHTNDAAGAIPRFLSMGVKPYLLAPAINSIIGQRLVRRICDNCKTEIKLESEKLERVKKILADLPKDYQVDLNNLKFYYGKGCEKCQGLGYHGRIGIYEVLTMNSEIEKVILSGKVSEYQMRDLAKKQGMITMVQDGLLKAIDGITTVDEVFRVAE